MGECCVSGMLDCHHKCTAVLGQEAEVVGTPITHTKADSKAWAWAGFPSRMGGTSLENVARFWVHAKTLPLLLILETPYYAFIK